jgi:small subunit ribosomal protein S17
MAEQETNDNTQQTPEVEAVAQAVPEPTAPAEVLTPKERKQRARTAKAAKLPVRQTRTPEERQAERDAQRKRKAGERRTQREQARAKARAASSGPAVATAPREHEPGAQKTRQGIVVSDRADKTITVRIDIARRHRRYSKIVRISRTLHAHDEHNDAHTGDTVIVRESRPLSRSKRWRLVEVVERAK